MAPSYFYLKNSTGPEVGVVPQTRVALGEIDLNEVHNKKLYEPTDTSLNLNYIQLADKARLTDFVSTGILGRDGFMISDKAWQVLKKHNLCVHQVIPAVLELRNKKHENYQWLHFAEDNSKGIVFSESVLMTFKNTPIEIPGWNYDYQKVDAKDHEEFFRFSQQKSSLRLFTAERLTFQKELADRDMIILRGFERPAIVSDRLKDAIENGKVTGMEFKAVPFAVQFV
jgi:hypothetical protein